MDEGIVGVCGVEEFARSICPFTDVPAAYYRDKFDLPSPLFTFMDDPWDKLQRVIHLMALLSTTTEIVILYALVARSPGRDGFQLRH